MVIGSYIIESVHWKSPRDNALKIGQFGGKKWEKRFNNEVSFIKRAGDGDRTRDVQLGKLAFYH